jgi:hypothetical protein
MRRAFLVILLVGSVADADPTETRFGLTATRTVQETQSPTDESQIPGPGLALDWVKVRSESHALGLHLAWNSGFNSTTSNSMPSHEESFDSLLQIHFLFELRDGPVTIGFGTGIDVLHRRAHYTDPLPFPDSSSSYTKTDKALGAHLQVGVEVGKIDRGTFSIVGSAGLFSLFQLAKLCDGELSCARQATTLSLGVAFSPR